MQVLRHQDPGILIRIQNCRSNSGIARSFQDRQFTGPVDAESATMFRGFVHGCIYAAKYRMSGSGQAQRAFLPIRSDVVHTIRKTTF